jgi:hypothetical protein
MASLLTILAAQVRKFARWSIVATGRLLAGLQPWAGTLIREPDPQEEISHVVIIYVGLLFGVLLFVHLMFPNGEAATGSSTSPTHQEIKVR